MARWGAAQRVEIADRVYRVRNNGPKPDEGGSTQDALILVLALPMLNSAGRARSVVDAFNDAHVALRRIA